MIRRLLGTLARPSLLRRLTLALLGASLVTTLVAAGGILYGMFKGRTGEWDLTNQRYAAALAGTLEGDQDPASIARRADHLRELHLQEYYLTNTPENRQAVVYQVLSREHGLISSSSETPLPALGGPIAGIHAVRIHGEPWWVATAVSPDGNTWVHVGSPNRKRWAQIWNGSDWALSMSVLFWGLTGLLFILAARKAIKPLFQLAGQVARRPAGDLSPVVPEVSYPETRPLVDALNDLLAQARQNLEMQKRFIADAAHELRTPLAVVNAQAHLLARAPSQPEREHAHEMLQDGLGRASQVIHQLLTVAELEGRPLPDRRPLELGGFLRQSAAECAPALLEAGCDLGFTGAEDPLWILGDAEALRSAIDNLLQNAGKYAGEGAQVDLRLRREGPWALVEVLDDGPGVPAEHLNRLSERFFRVPGAQASGSGLGLAIVRHVVEAHGGAVNFGTGLEGRGFGARLRLALDPPIPPGISG